MTKKIGERLKEYRKIKKYNVVKFSNILNIFQIQNMIPPYFLQISIGLYIIQIIFILTETLVTIDSGEDKLKQTNQISKNLLKGVLLYLITAFISIVMLSILSNVALGGIIG